MGAARPPVANARRVNDVPVKTCSANLCERSTCVNRHAIDVTLLISTQSSQEQRLLAERERVDVAQGEEEDRAARAG